MAMYLTRFSYTPETWARMTQNPEDRRDAARTYIESVGGKLHGFWYAFGEYDGYNLWEAPDSVSMAAVALAIGGGGALSKIETIPLTIHVAATSVAGQGKHSVQARLMGTGTVELDVTPSAGATVSVQAVQPTTGYSSGVVPAVATDVGTFRVTGLPLMTPGQWEIVTTVRDQSGVDEHVSPVTVTG